MSETETSSELTAGPLEVGRSAPVKVHVDALRPRDRVILQTAKGSFILTVGRNSHCILSSPAFQNKKTSQIILRGGTNAEVTEYTPNRIFVGGRLAYAFDEAESSLVTTSVIESLQYEPALR
jgi:hypothetical protein